MTFKELEVAQALPLDVKEAIAMEFMRAGFLRSRYAASIAFSGGKDSTVLVDMWKRNFPDERPYVIFCNTGVEYPESLRFAREYGRAMAGDRFRETQLMHTEAEGLKYKAQQEVLEWLIAEGHVGEILKPDGKLKSIESLERMVTPEMMEDFRRRKLVWPKGTPMSYWWCVDQYGVPMLGKAASKLDARRINIDCFLTFSESVSEDEKLLKYYDLLRQVKISQHCCTVLKKEPSERLQAELGVDVIFKGLMAAESRSRKTNFCSRGYIFESTRPHLGEDPFFHVNPLSIWTDDDIWAYIRKYDVPYSPLYDMGYTDQKGVFHAIPRNGCFGCATDIAYPHNHMSMLRRTHPGPWKAVMKHGGMADELRKLRLYRANGQTTIMDVLNTEELLEERPCAFDSINQLIVTDDTLEEYDADAE